MPVLPPGLSPEFLEPILKAELSKHKFLNLGGFLFGALVDATLFGMIMVMLGYWVSYVPKERLHVKVILVSLAFFNREDWYGRLIVAFRNPFLPCARRPLDHLRHATGMGRTLRHRMYRVQLPLDMVSLHPSRFRWHRSTY
jgi:hypothetical protein